MTLVPLNSKRMEPKIRDIFTALYRTWGRQHWWPADSAFEVILGAFLTQNTAWTNVELALANLRAAKALTLEGIRNTPPAELEQLIRPAGYFRQKAHRLKIFVAHVDENYGGSLDQLFSRPTNELREELLSLHGIGPETADAILLYAGQHEIFVVDAYTRRILARHGIAPETAAYDDIRLLVERALSDPTTRDLLHHTEVIEEKVTHKPAGAHHSPSSMSTAPRSERAQIFNEMHGLLVGVAKNYCHSRRALCEQCPLQPLLQKPLKLAKLATLVRS